MDHWESISIGSSPTDAMSEWEESAEIRGDFRPQKSAAITDQPISGVPMFILSGHFPVPVVNAHSMLGQRRR